MSKVDQFVRAFDEAGDFADARIQKYNQIALEDIDELMRNPDRRDRKLWKALDVSRTLTVERYEREKNRDLDWILGFGAMASAASTQFILEYSPEIIFEPEAYATQKLDRFDMDRTELIAAGKREAVGSASAPVTRFEELQRKYLSRFESISKLEPVDLFRTLQRMKALPAIEKVTADAIGYVSRMTNYGRGTVQFKEAVSNLVDHVSTRVIKGQARRAVERLHTAREIDGNDNQLLVWVGEGGKNTCDYCVDRFGEIRTYAQWLTEGMPGADVCRGGDLCKCGLAAVWCLL